MPEFPRGQAFCNIDQSRIDHSVVFSSVDASMVAGKTFVTGGGCCGLWLEIKD
ncbi:hypothetical protein D8674_015541 [Pyrus ussuriensis x Pyrus communis]|uniref:Uncharacterized protein n=1 Tax=Pyrus ussuriensis x Pyrus communis TaxID=2448454 RepID=A0A5N5H0S9_9ROSA|nr:hypothetical protein D8674_015541 [Pyrus ussuriensis x Pyrus communis]